jgi:hypothetical protein
VKQEESIWFEARSLDGVYKKLLDGDYFKTCDSVEETRQALDRHIQEFHREGEVFSICKVTYRKFFDETGRMIKKEEITEAVEQYPAA